MSPVPRRPRAFPTAAAGLLLLVAVTLAPFWLGARETEHFEHAFVLNPPQMLTESGPWGGGGRVVPARVATSVYLVQLWTPVLLWAVLSVALPGRLMLRLDAPTRCAVAVGALGVWAILLWPPFRVGEWSGGPDRSWAPALRRPWVMQPRMTDTYAFPKDLDAVVLATEVAAVAAATAIAGVVLSRKVKPADS